MKMVKVVCFVPFAWSDTLREGHKMIERICRECNATSTQEDLYEDGQGGWLCTICMKKFLDERYYEK